VYVNGKLHSKELEKQDIDKINYSTITACDVSVDPDSQRDVLSGLSLATAETLHQIEILKNAHLELPIVFLNLVINAKQSIVAQAISILMNENSHATVYEIQKNFDSEHSFSNESVLAKIEANAHLEWIRLQDISNENARITHTVADVFEKGLFTHFNISINGNLLRNNIDVRLKGEFSDTKLYGANLAGNNSQIDNSTLIRHLVPNCESTENYKNISGSGGFTIFNGKIFVERDAQKTNAYQSNKNLLLSESAKSNAKPELEIYADDVKCSHGSTTGRLDETALFYLRARGLKKQSAKNLMMLAFLNDAIIELSHPEIKEKMSILLENKLTQLQNEI
jgi:Fe-S cluster assembly protein SufD